MKRTVALSARVEAWRSAWQSGDAALVARLYAADARHESAKVALAMPGLGRSHLRGRAEIEAYALRAFARVHPLRFDIVSLSETETTSTVEYLRHAPDAAPMLVREILTWRGPALADVRVEHP